ncbi:MAG: phenylalanine--tRNA ligase subunit beta [Halothiobacillaceae bacterium]
MRFSEQWLREWVDPDLDTEALAHRLTMAGLEVDAIEPAAGEFADVVVGHVVEVAAHPDADKLRVCQVEDGSGTRQQVVCGAPNVRAGMRAPFARLGAVLPGNLRIKRAKLRGVESFGMLCSATELGLGDEGGGLWDLPADAPVGTDLRDWLELDDRVIELGITPNRGDALSIRGIARETAALTGLTAAGPALAPVHPTIDEQPQVMVHEPQACPRYGLRMVRGVNPDARTPLWMQERLRRGGLRCISPVVDVTNYVLLELGQPMHAFDRRRIAGDISVRMARSGERLEALDGQTLTLTPDMLVIADRNGPVALAGIIGGAASAVGEGCTEVLLESAHFRPEAIVGRARQFGLNTDSSYRFERGVDPTLPEIAMERATALLLEIAGGEAGPVHWVGQDLPGQEPVQIDAAFFSDKLGISVAADEAAAMLRRLGMDVSRTGDHLSVTPPPHRFDIHIREDLVEEVARMIGYDHIRAETPRARLAQSPMPETELPRSRVADLLVDRGYHEVITYSFVAESLLARLTPEQPPVALANPISREMAVMRTTLWAGLLDTAAFNMHRQQARLRLFETGLRFRPDPAAETGVAQEDMIAGLLAGPKLPEQWGVSERPVDFFDAKGDLEAILSLSRQGAALSFEAAEHPALHPGQSARIVQDDRTVGWIGALHPGHQQALDLPGRIYLFEIERSVIAEAPMPAYRPVSRFPSIRRDLALLVPDRIAATGLTTLVRSLDLPTLQSLVLFDIYRGKGVETGFASIALGLIFQDNTRTLTDTDIQSAIDRILAVLGDNGIELRG